MVSFQPNELMELLYLLFYTFLKSYINFKLCNFNLNQIFVPLDV